MRTHLKQGSALLSVLMILVLAGILVLAMQTFQGHTLRKSTQFTRTLQAWHYALGAESYARHLLAQHYKPEMKADYPDRWMKADLPYELPEGGSIAIVIDDAQGKFNVNSFSQNRKRSAEIFSALMVAIGVKKARADAVLAALIAMAKTHSAATGEGDAAAAIDQGICPGRPILADASQLIDLGLGMEEYRKLAPYVIALPGTCINLNINAATGLMEKVAAGDDEKLARIRSIKAEKGYLTMGDINAVGLGADIIASSHYFQARINVTYDDRRYGLIALMKRSANKNNQLKIHTVIRNWQRGA